MVVPIRVFIRVVEIAIKKLMVTTVAVALVVVMYAATDVLEDVTIHALEGVQTVVLVPPMQVEL